MFLILFLTFSQLISAQDEKVLSGRVLDAITNSALAGATIQDSLSGVGTATGINGDFKLDFKRNQVSIRIAYLGYQNLDTTISLTENNIIDFYIYPEAIEYEEVVVSADMDGDYVSAVRMSEIHLKKEDIEKLPALLGEADPMRILQLTPGVQSSTEGGLGFYVRGGGVDQNLVLFDQTCIYNPGHLFGFISVFNPDLIQNVRFMKSGIPAMYGGRLSSVVRVDPERGRSDSLRIRGQIGMVSSRIALSRSFAGDKGSFIVSARLASIDLIVKPIIGPLLENSNPIFKESSYYFWDINGGISYRIGEKNYLNFSGFYGKDNHGLARSTVRGELAMIWDNVVLTGRWTHLISDFLNIETSISHTAYNFGMGGAQSEYNFNLASSIRDYNFKSKLEYYPAKHKVSSGVELTYHSFVPNEVDVMAPGVVFQFLDFNKLYSYEGGLFVDDEFSLSERFSVALGLRYSFFNQVGPYKEYLYDETSQVKDSIMYPAGESLAFYHHPEPRASLKFQLNKDASIKASYMHMAQYIHLASSSTISLPSDIWLPSSKSILPQIGDQLSLGYFRNWMNSRFESSVEIYYKSTQNQIEFIRGILNNSLRMTMEENLAVGNGRSYGIEFFLKKNTGSLTAWISYTIGKTERQFDRINEGKIYPAKYDRRHDFSITGMYQINKHWNVSSVFVFVSGNAFTLPIGRYIIQGNLVNEYGEVNNFRMPPYHRLDLSATRSRITEKGNLSSWIFSIVNIYNRSNPYHLFFEASGDLEEYRIDIEPKMVSLFPIIPSISWRFEF